MYARDEMMTVLLRRLHTLPILGLLILSLLTGPVSASGYVWCVGADGHAVVEGAMAGDCGLDNPPAATDGTTSAALTIGVDDCGPCLDIPPSHQWGSPRNRQDGSPLSFPAEFAPVFVTTDIALSDRLHTSPLVASPPPRTPEPILHHRTIVLLI